MDCFASLAMTDVYCFSILASAISFSHAFRRGARCLNIENNPMQSSRWRPALDQAT